MTRTHNHVHDLCITVTPITELKPYARNPRTHSKHQVKQIASSIRKFGFTNPILIDAAGSIIAGHGRLEAAKLMQLESVPVIKLGYLTEAEKRAYIIADNKLAENAGWNIELLQTEIQSIISLDLDFDLTLTGFEVAEIDKMMIFTNDDDDIDDIPSPDTDDQVSVLGDVWILGEHRLLCGDATQKSSSQKLLGDQKADMIFTDPPYNVAINGHVCGNGKKQHSEFKMASGEMSPEQFTTFLRDTISQLCDYSTNGSLHYICMDWRHIQELMQAAAPYKTFMNLCVWNKSNGGMGSLYRSKHELVFVYKNGTSPHINNVQLGKHGRYRTNVWDYAGVNTFENSENLSMHPTVKPVKMIQDAILDCTKRGQLVLDVFGGSGSTLMAAERSGRRAYLMEFDPKYIDVIIRRYIEFTGNAVMHEDGRSFKEVQEARYDI